MPLRFRRTIKVAPGVKLNLSKSGVSTTVGTKNIHFNFGKRGVKRTVSIPGTGISEVDYIKKNKSESEKEKEKESEERKEEAEEKREERLEARQEEKEHNETSDEAPSRSTRARRAAAAPGSSELRNAFLLLAVVVFFFAGAAMLGLVPTHFFSNSLQYLAHLVQSTGH